MVYQDFKQHRYTKTWKPSLSIEKLENQSLWQKLIPFEPVITKMSLQKVIVQCPDFLRTETSSSSKRSGLKQLSSCYKLRF